MKVRRQLDPLRMLLIEDDEQVRDTIRIALEDAFGPGVTITCVADRVAALTQDLQSYDLILCDLHFSDGHGNGMEFLQDVRRRCKTPVILVTDENVGHLVAESIRKGATDYIIRTSDFLQTLPMVVQKNFEIAKIRRENERLSSELEKVLQEVCEKNAQLERSLQMVEELASTDPLTSLYNRRYFSRMLDQSFGEARRYRTPLSCIMIDLDKFKQLNDTLGHQKGDDLVVLAAKAITDNLRKVDIASRYGGDEFILLLPHTTAANARIVAERIRNQFKPESKARLNLDFSVTMSIGVAELDCNHMNTSDQLVSLADKALYGAKANGRDCVYVQDPIAGAVASVPSTAKKSA